MYVEGTNFAFLLRDSVNLFEFELLYIRFARNEQILRFTIRIPRIPMSFKYFILNLQGISKLCFSVRNSNNSLEFELLYIRFTKKMQTSRFAVGIPRLPMSVNYFISDLQRMSKLRVLL